MPNEQTKTMKGTTTLMKLWNFTLGRFFSKLAIAIGQTAERDNYRDQ